MNAKIPIIASDVGGIPDIVKHHTTGYLVPPSNAEKLIEGIEVLMGNDLQRNMLADNAFAQLASYSPETMADSYLKLYLSL